MGVKTAPPGGHETHESKHLALHPKVTSAQRILRSQGHRNLPNFVGQRFPRSDDTDAKPFYYASILALLKPWRNLGTDLKQPDQTWETAFEDFLEEASWKERRVISDLQYFHENDSR